jgi:hypothetical protein
MQASRQTPSAARTTPHAGDPAVRQGALGCLASLCYSHANRRAVRAVPGLLASVAELARYRPGSRAASTADKTPPPPPPPSLSAATPAAAHHSVFASDHTRLAALRVLAVLGADCTPPQSLSGFTVSDEFPYVWVMAGRGGGGTDGRMEGCMHMCAAQLEALISNHLAALMQCMLLQDATCVRTSLVVHVWLSAACARVCGVRMQWCHHMMHACLA